MDGARNPPSPTAEENPFCTNDLRISRGRKVNIDTNQNTSLANHGSFRQSTAKQYMGWQQTTRTWKYLMKKSETEEQTMNHKWAQTDTRRLWTKRFTNIWRSPLPHRDKVWLWKLLQQGLPTMERVAKWGKSDGNFCRCKSAIESMEHLFLDCRHTQEKWNECRKVTTGSALDIRETNDLFQIMDETWKGKCTAKIVFFVKILWSIWLERNSSTYNAKDIRIPIKVAARQTADVLSAKIDQVKTGSEIASKLKHELNLISSLFQLDAPDNQESQATNDDTPTKT
ncbi:hypothetical protein R1sor_017740 [Riccia sorocarpa]|uniref:Reverse transcriptase zinc-binding domain-containing protein n=1 Tax=Riccia sorocarpa TaxID=122646 RepID=A0ABD3I7Q0_9MARC